MVIILLAHELQALPTGEVKNVAEGSYISLAQDSDERWEFNLAYLEKNLYQLECSMSLATETASWKHSSTWIRTRNKQDQ
jgi:hypothetical protein